MAVNEMVLHRLPIAYVTDGQTIPDDIKRVDETQLVEKILASTGQNNRPEEVMAIKASEGFIDASN